MFSSVLVHYQSSLNEQTKSASLWNSFQSHSCSVLVKISNMEADKRVKHKNPHLEEMKDDVLYHIGLNTKQELKQMFGDVKVIIP